MTSHFFKTFEFEFEATRLMWIAPSGGSDFAEVAAVTEKIKDGHYQSWHLEWKNFAQKLENRAQGFLSTTNKANALMRASRYYQAAEFFLDPSDTAKLEMYQKSVSLFYQALALTNVQYSAHTIQYQETPLRTLYFKTHKQSKGTFFVCGGFDALLEELYFTSAIPALNNGYDVVLYEGPGQSDMIRYHQLSFEKNWQLVVKEVIDFYQHHYQLRMPKIGIGISLGGLLTARAASLDASLFDRIVLYNYFPSMIASFKKSLPFFLHRYLDTQFPTWLEKIASTYIAHKKFLNWQVEHAKWTFAATSLNDLIQKCRDFNEEIALSQLHTDCLTFVAKNDNYYDYHLGLYFHQAIPAKNKKLILFDKENYSTDLHCQNGSFYDCNDQLYEWLLAK
ncbi:alpha/beta fold hydrolase domain-containing protein [Isobaculum melis]|uniref:Serine aminopeptidase, S33 n=1 Tax=Isobaculum melis TaxID=142588 RepID=A0A1H9QJA0_9LACT|nr:alpha/beta hydrolase [Isobaculum melis]SER59833.1 Serine aminopeptidase, S33 [Isobaculum melis]